MKNVLGILGGLVFVLQPVSLHAGAQTKGRVQAAEIRITQKGYEPRSLKLATGAPIRLTFTRNTDDTCAKEIVLQELGIRRPLALNKPEVVEITAKQIGAAKKLTFICGMKMMSGEIVLE